MSSASAAAAADASERAAQLDVLAQFREISGGDAEAARSLLEATGWSLEDALALHFAAGDDAAAGPSAAPVDAYGAGPTGSTSVQHPAAAASRPSSSSEARGSAGAAATADSAAPQESWLSTIGRWATDISQTVLGIAPEDFEAWFAARHGAPTPTFCKDCFGEANKKALENEKLLLLWFHKEESSATTKLCREVLQNSNVLALLERSYVLWGGDIGRFEPGQVARLLELTMFPSLVVCQPLPNGWAGNGFCLEWPLGSFAQPLLSVSPRQTGECINSDEAMAALTAAAEDHYDATVRRREERELRSLQIAEERMLREEQDREYEEALLADQIAEAQKASSAAASPVGDVVESRAALTPPAARTEDPEAAAEAAAAAEASEVARQTEERRQARGAELRATPEPDAAAGPLARISLRVPSGDRLQRVFLASQPMSDVYEWARCCRPAPDPASFELCTNFPARTFGDSDETLQDLGLCPSAAFMLRATCDNDGSAI